MSETGLLITLSQAPIVFLFFYVYFQDKHGYEPLGLLLRSLAAGAISFAAAFALEWVFLNLNHSVLGPGDLTTAVDAIILVALIEEGVKFIALYLAVFRNPDFNEPYDGIMYAVAVSLGFAAVENLGYCLDRGLPTAVFRVFTAVPMHAMAGVLMGYYVGLAKFNRPHRDRLLAPGLIAAAIGHGLYDYFLLLPNPVLFPVALCILGVQILLGWRAIRHHRDIVLTFPDSVEPPQAQAGRVSAAKISPQAAIEANAVKSNTGIDPAIASDPGLLGQPLRWATITMKVLGLSAMLAGWFFYEASYGYAHRYLGIPIPSAIMASVLAPAGIACWATSENLKKLKPVAWKLSVAFFFFLLPTIFFPLALLGIYGVLHPETRSLFGHKPPPSIPTVGSNSALA